MYAYTEKTLESIIIYFIKHKLKIKLRSYSEKLIEIPNIFRSIALLLFYYQNQGPAHPIIPPCSSSITKINVKAYTVDKGEIKCCLSD